jgi:hypothetical protein
VKSVMSVMLALLSCKLIMHLLFELCDFGLASSSATRLSAPVLAFSAGEGSAGGA